MEKQDILFKHYQNQNVVKDKISAILVCKHIQGTSTAKTGRSGEKYLATNELNPEIVQLLKQGVRYKATGKVDGTCTLIKDNTICKRRDIKSGREIPATWFQTGFEESKDQTHMIGFMSLEKGDKWQIDCHVKTDKGYNMEMVNILDLNEDKTGLVYKQVKISELNDKSVEMMGPKFQGNPHKLKLHCLILHGLIHVSNFPDLNEYIKMEQKPNIVEAFKSWFLESKQGQYLEGIVLHFDNGKMFKIHRHHLDLEWSMDKIPPLDEFQFN
jgi:hypothetical protein